jgi:hypothetical protein
MLGGWEKVDAEDAWVPGDTCERCGESVTEGEVLVHGDPSDATMGYIVCSEECAEWVEETFDEET